MVYRFVVSFIWIFWLVMVTLLIRSEYFDETASFYRLPIPYAAGRIFKSDTGSELSIFYKQTYVGRLRLEPSPSERRVLSGLMKLDWPVLGRKISNEVRFSVDFDHHLGVQRFNVTSQGEGLMFRASGNRDGDLIEGTMESAGSVWNRSLSWSEIENKPISELLADSRWAEQIHLPPGALSETGGRMTWYAASANLKVGERTFDALLIATEGNRDYWVKIWLTPSGEVILVQTSPAVGITLENKALVEINS